MDDFPLLFPSSAIFEGNNTIDKLRQTFIDLENSPDDEEIEYFLENSKKYLSTDIDIKTANELFTTISSCFSHYPKQSLAFFNDFLENSRSNSNYIVITSYIIYELTRIEPRLDLPDYHSFVDESLKEILPQLQNSDNTNLTIFGHTIPSNFIANLIFNLLLASDLTDQLISDFFSYVIFNSKFELLAEKIAHSKSYKILTQTADSNNELFEFITNKDFSSFSKLSEQAKSLIECAVVFTKSEEKKEFSIEGLNKETVLQFAAVASIYLQNDGSKSKQKINNLIVDGLNYAQTVDLPVLNESINELVFNYLSIFGKGLIQIEALIQSLEILINQQEIKKEYRMNLFVALFELTERDEITEIIKFLNVNGSKILEIFIENLNEINENEVLEKIKLNLGVFDTTVLINHLQESSSLEEAKQIIYFIERLCFNVPPIKNTDDLSGILLLFFNELIQDGLWDDVLLIGTFVKKYGGFELFQEFRNEETIPIYIKETLFGYIISEQDNVDQLLEKMLNDRNVELKDKSFLYLFEKMIENEDLKHLYLVYSVNRYRDFHLTIGDYLTAFLREFLKFQDDFVKVTNEVYYFNRNEGFLFKKPDFKFASIPVPEYGLSIVEKLYQSIQNDKQVFQSFYILKTIASSFPFLFGQDPQKVFETVLPYLDDYFLLFNPHPNDEEFIKLKTVYSAYSFLLIVLQSTIILDQFFDWMFTKITSFSDSQVVALFVVLRLINGEVDVKIYINSMIWKYGLFEKCGELLSRGSNQSDLVKSISQLNIIRFLEEVYNIYPTFRRHELIFIDDMMKMEKPFENYFNNFVYTFPCVYLFSSITFNSFSERLLKFMYIADKIKVNDLCYGIADEPNQPPNMMQMNFFASQLNSDEIVDYDVLPNFEDSLSIRMIKYLLKQPFYIYSHIFFKKKLSVTPDMFEKLIVTIEEMSSMQNKAKENPDEEDKDSTSINIDDFVLKYLCQQTLLTSILKIIYDGGVEKSNYIALLKAFDHFAKNNIAYFSFMSLFSDFLKNIHLKNIGREKNQSFLNGINNLIELLLNLPKNNTFKDSFASTCGDEILDICLSPICRNDSTILLNVSNLFSLLPDQNLSNRVTHLISFLFQSKNEKLIKAGLDLSSKLTSKQLDCVGHLILEYFDQDTKEGDISDTFINFMKKFPSFFIVKNYQLFSLLVSLLDKYAKSSQTDNTLYEKICFLFNFLAPKRDLSLSFSSAVDKSSIIPQFIMETSPSFWQIFEKYNDLIISNIRKEPLLLNKFKFLLNYPELLAFDIRSSYFRKEMKSRIDFNNKITINVKSDNLLESSYESLKNVPTELLYQQFNVVIDNSKTVDHGGVTCDWFTKLAKEIFNHENGYFSCIEKSMSYQPNVCSINKKDYLEFFRFAGQFVARALIEGICIDAHFTLSFIKQILHRKPKLNDLETVDNNLFESLNWMLDNDVDMLEMMFEVFDETGTNSTIPLKENGTNIKVTNENKVEYVNLMSNYHLEKKIQKQIDAFVDGFDSLISHSDVSYFTPNELDLLICGVPKIDVEDFKANTVVQLPYTMDSPVIKFFFNVISRWENDQLIKLLSFMTGRSRVTSNGFKEFCEISGQPLTINSGGDKSLLPQSHTCVNTLSLPQYESEEELEKKLKIAINLCDSFEII